MATLHGAPSALRMPQTPTACFEPGSVHAEISHERGMGEETMMAFIHKYLNSILQPFADSAPALPPAHTALDTKMGNRDRILKLFAAMFFA